MIFKKRSITLNLDGRVIRTHAQRGSGYTGLLMLGIFGLVAAVVILLFMMNKLENFVGLGSLTGKKGDVNRPNIVFISIDSLRADHLSCYGYGRKTSPSIDRLASQGVLFEKVYSTTSWTLPSHLAMMTGLPDQVHQVTTHTRSLSDKWPTMAEVLKDEGYATAGFYSGPYLHPIFGFSRGFDTYESCIRTDTVFDGYMKKDRTLLTPKERKVWNDKMNGILGDRTAPDVLAAALHWLKEKPNGPDAEKPFFLFLHFFDVHYDYVPPEAFDRFYPDYKGTIDGRNFENNTIYHAGMAKDDLERVISLYDGEILWVDHHIGMLLDEIETMGLRETTAIALTSDHGDEFFEHGAKGHRNVNGLFDEVLRVPFILSFPPQTAMARQVGGQFRIYDFMPTMLDLSGSRIPETVLGESMLPYALDVGHPPLSEVPSNLALSELTRLSKAVAAAVDTPDTKDRILSMRSDGYNVTYFAYDGRVLLFDLAKDPGEKDNLAEKNKKLADRKLEGLKRQDERFLRMGGPFERKSLKDLDPEVRRQLEELGYIK